MSIKLKFTVIILYLSYWLLVSGYVVSRIVIHSSCIFMYLYRVSVLVLFIDITITILFIKEIIIISINYVIHYINYLYYCVVNIK